MAIDFDLNSSEIFETVEDEAFFWQNYFRISFEYPIYNRVQKILEKLRKLRKSYNHKRNINGIYNEKLHYNCLHQLPTVRLKT